MKLVQVSTFYQSYLDQFYRKNPIANEPYSVQKRALDWDAFGWSDFWANALNPLGYDSTVLIANAENLQRAWARENAFGSDFDVRGVLVAQLKALKPEILFIEDHLLLNEQELREIREAVPSIRVVMGSCGSPLRGATVFRQFDFTFTCIPELVATFSEMGATAYHLPHAFDARVLERVESESEKEKFTFIGQIARSSSLHLEREKVLEALAEKTGIKIYSPSANITKVQELKALLKISAYYARLYSATEKPRWPVSLRLKPYLRSAVYGLEMFQKLKTSQVTLNKHIDLSPKSASNMRMFEATGMGACLLTDAKENLSELFSEGTEVVSYSSTDEAVEKARWLLDHPKKAAEIALAGQKRTLRDHGFSQRAPILHSWIQEHLRKERAR